MALREKAVRTEVKEGSNPDTRKLAQAIIDVQVAEITVIKQLGGTQEHRIGKPLD